MSKVQSVIIESAKTGRFDGHWTLLVQFRLPNKQLLVLEVESAKAGSTWYAGAPRWSVFGDEPLRQSEVWPWDHLVNVTGGEDPLAFTLQLADLRDETLAIASRCSELIDRAHRDNDTRGRRLSAYCRKLVASAA